MFPSRNIEFSKKLDSLIGRWNISISCEFIILRRKHLFTLKLLGYFKDYEIYISRKIQVEILSFEIFKIPKKSRIRCFPLSDCINYKYSSSVGMWEENDSDIFVYCVMRHADNKITQLGARKDE
jgi:hypothetical protein